MSGPAVFRSAEEMYRAAHATADRLRREVSRLRSLILDTQDRNGYRRSHGDDSCVWCGETFSVTDDHKPDCPAFNPDGTVK